MYIYEIGQAALEDDSTYTMLPPYGPHNASQHNDQVYNLEHSTHTII